MKRIIFLCCFLLAVFAVKAQAQTKSGYQQTVATVGDTAPDFLQYDVNGKPVRLSDFRGKYLLLDFWGSSCAPCRKSHPHLIQVYNRYKAKKFTILSVSVYDMPWHKDLWLNAIKKDGLTWTQVATAPNEANAAELANMRKKYKTAGFGGSSGVNEAAAKYGVHGLPRNFLIDPLGKVIAVDLKGDALDAMLAKML
jgi:thiol-disulfide isomerase/thioredoxin